MLLCQTGFTSFFHARSCTGAVLVHKKGRAGVREFLCGFSLHEVGGGGHKVRCHYKV